jgi:hypothetical protein
VASRHSAATLTQRVEFRDLGWDEHARLVAADEDLEHRLADALKNWMEREGRPMNGRETKAMAWQLSARM